MSFAGDFLRFEVGDSSLYGLRMTREGNSE